MTRFATVHTISLDIKDAGVVARALSGAEERLQEAAEGYKRLYLRSLDNGWAEQWHQAREEVERVAGQRKMVESYSERLEAVQNRQPWTHRLLLRDKAVGTYLS